jgi:polysaccharide biosynthesis protein VpsQ
MAFGGCLAFVAFVIFAADTGGARWLFGWMDGHPGSDKVGHVVLVGALAFFLNVALRGTKLAGVMFGGLLVAIALTLEEASQAWFPSRNFDFMDICANLTGVFAADLISRWWLKRRLARRDASATSSDNAKSS